MTAIMTPIIKGYIFAFIYLCEGFIIELMRFTGQEVLGMDFETVLSLDNYKLNQSDI